MALSPNLILSHCGLHGRRNIRGTLKNFGVSQGTLEANHEQWKGLVGLILYPSLPPILFFLMVFVSYYNRVWGNVFNQSKSIIHQFKNNIEETFTCLFSLQKKKYLLICFANKFIGIELRSEEKRHHRTQTLEKEKNRAAKIFIV